MRYCKRHQRQLLVYKLSWYHINMHDYFRIEDVICDSRIIDKMFCKSGPDECSVYPALTIPLCDILKDPFILKFAYDCRHKHDGVYFDLPLFDKKEDVIVTSFCGGGDGYPMFRQISFTNVLKRHCRKLFRSVNSTKYLCIQVRHTDYENDYKKLYWDNKELIHRYDTVYLCTDNADVVNYFQSKRDRVLNFTTFPTGKSKNLHSAQDISPDTKIKDMIGDIMLACGSHAILSTSQGGFIRLLRRCRENKDLILKKLT